jgi:hypothetical protein
MMASKNNVFGLETQEVEGWFFPFDVSVFGILLSQQSDSGVRGNLLEIGVYQGKSAIALARRLGNDEKLHVCDTFTMGSISTNSPNIPMRYSVSPKAIFEGNLKKFSGVAPVIHECDSLELPKRLKGKSFRFIHIDGAHDYFHAREDIVYAASALDALMGIVAVDDFVLPGFVGVVAAVWETILERRLKPYLMTPNKIYLVEANSQWDINVTRQKLEEAGVITNFVTFFDFTVLRTEDFSLAMKGKRNPLKSQVVRFIPPILADLIRTAMKII